MMPLFCSARLILVAAAVCAGPAKAGEAVPEGYRSVATEFGVPHTLLYAVALTESGRSLDTKGFRPWPWTLNVSGQGHYYRSRIQAWQALRQSLENGKTSIDIGLMILVHALDPPGRLSTPTTTCGWGRGYCRTASSRRGIGGSASVATTHPTTPNGRIDTATGSSPDGSDSAVLARMMSRSIHHWPGRLVILLVLVLNPMVGVSALEMIYDSGDTRPIAPFLAAFDAAEVTPSQPLKSATLQLGAADLSSILPIRSPGLTPGRVRARSHDRPFARPFFLIGSDAYSRQWLQNHRDRLAEIGAMGMLVQADTREDLQAIIELAQGLPILPASATDIGRALGISHYPVLISSKGIEQ